MNLNPKSLVKKIRPTRNIVLTFLIIIFIGSFLLSMPIATANGVRVQYIDALFTSVSSVCVIGLALFNTSTHWSVFGKIVIIVLVQIGGIGLMTFVTMANVLSRRRITLSQRMIIRDSFNQDNVQGMVKLVTYIIKFTFIMEAAMAALLTIRFSLDYPMRDALAKGIFHSVSAFCNAGFDTFGDSSISLYRGDITVNAIIIILTVTGGLGFPVLMDIKKGVTSVFVEHNSFKKAYGALELHTKIVIHLSLFLFISAALFFFFAELNNPRTLGRLSLKDKMLASTFQSATLRTSGFYTINQNSLTNSSKLLSMILMFIGGSPSGTAGGIKTVTIGVLLAAVYSTVNGYDSVRVFGRKISYFIIQKALAVFLLGQACVFITAMLLSFTESTRYFGFTELLFEAISAFSTAGISMGLTEHLSFWGKIIIMVAMFIGRLGPISIVTAITVIHSNTKNNFDYPEGRIIIG